MRGKARMYEPQDLAFVQEWEAARQIGEDVGLYASEILQYFDMRERNYKAHKNHSRKVRPKHWSEHGKWK